jgi:hypothetical protein
MGSPVMALWTFMTLVGNGRKIYVEQVRENDFQSAPKAWARAVEVEGMTEEARKRMASWEPPDDAVEEFVWDWDSGVWTFDCHFGMDDHPEEWGRDFPAVWVIKTDNRPLSQGYLFRPTGCGMAFSA